VFGETPNTARGTRALPVHRFPGFVIIAFTPCPFFQLLQHPTLTFQSLKAKTTKEIRSSVRRWTLRNCRSRRDELGPIRDAARFRSGSADLRVTQTSNFEFLKPIKILSAVESLFLLPRCSEACVRQQSAVAIHRREKFHPLR
jgi:hypothetical protein